ncbi:MAG: GNAT family N-acetyltransferase [Burkholderiales bacterium]|nr:GNAT family N-acetyltransferase [Burkholderiales bacterium]
MIEIVKANLDSPSHGEAVIGLLNFYAMDQMGGGEELPAHVKQNLVAELRKRPAAHVVLAFADGAPAGLAICMEGFSTFACQPLLNIHDFAVAPQYRRRGIAKMMLEKVEEIARSLGCCKLTLEVLEGNRTAQSLYRACGFAGYALDPAMGHALFWQKKLDDR